MIAADAWRAAEDPLTQGRAARSGDEARRLYLGTTEALPERNRG